MQNKNTRSEHFPKTSRPKVKRDKSLIRERVETRLYSVGEDNFLIEYNVAKSKAKLEVESFDQIENQYLPNCLLEYTDTTCGGDTQGLLVANQGSMTRLQAEAVEREQTRAGQFEVRADTTGADLRVAHRRNDPAQFGQVCDGREEEAKR